MFNTYQSESDSSDSESEQQSKAVPTTSTIPLFRTKSSASSATPAPAATHLNNKRSEPVDVVDVTLGMKASDFSFPYEAYDIQVNFMRNMYRAIDQKKIGIFESPTGTGKSLSIICSALTWLLDHSNDRNDGTTSHSLVKSNRSSSQTTSKNTRKRQIVDSSSDEENDEPAWIKQQEKQISEQNLKDKILMEQEKQEKRKDRVDLYQRKRAKFLMGALETVKKQEKSKSVTGKVDELQDDSDLLLVDYEDHSAKSRSSVLNQLNIGVKGSLLDDLFSSDEEEDMNAARKARKRGPSSIFADENDEDENPDVYHTPKIIYCSRTHTQLNQFVQEVQKTEFREKIRLVSLASRKQMCTHPVVSKVQSQNRINELCLDMKRKSDRKHKCPYDDQSGFKLFKDHVLIKVRDIEDLVSLGKRLETCSYYGSRKAVPHAQVITIPYNSLIHQPTRESLGIKLEDCVVIIDEAHNLVDSVIHTHSFQITQAQVQQCHMQLTGYYEKYKSRLKAANQTNVTQLLEIMSCLLTFLKSGINGQIETSDNSSDQTVSEVLNLNDFSYRSRINNINMFHVCEFIERSELTKKLNGFVERKSTAQVAIHRKGSRGEEEEGIESGIHAFTSFLLALTNISKDGKILVQTNKTNPSNSLIKFVLLNPSIYFREIVEKSRSVVLAGGTMEPISSVIQQLFPDRTERIERFQCGHVIPDENILPICLSSAPSSNPFDFTFKSRNSPTTMNDLGTLICNLCNVVPDGVVLFFPSYSYEHAVYDYWFKNSVIRKIEMKKKYYREPKSSTEVDQVLSDYKRTIDRSKIDKDKQYSFQGAVLSCVVGGKMSEGINFSDGYGRLVVVVGLPYPNPNDMELKEKMEYLNSKQKGSGSEYYDDITMKAVNQSIGRSIRHAKDYASILLLDKRYSKSNIQSKLPNWIRSRLVVCDSFGPAFSQVTRFFKSKNSIATTTSQNLQPN